MLLFFERPKENLLNDPQNVYRGQDNSAYGDERQDRILQPHAVETQKLSYETARCRQSEGSQAANCHDHCNSWHPLGKSPHCENIARVCFFVDQPDYGEKQASHDAM